MKERKGRSQFPRSSSLPAQSSRYWAKEKDRYLRQLLISDIEEQTGRELVVYFSRLDQMISETDGDDIAEILEGVENKKAVDLLIHTAGGLVDAVEKFVIILKQLGVSYRVIVPSWAKSGGTLIALSSERILLGVNSELGPIDPQIYHPEYGQVAAEFIASDPSQPEVLKKICQVNVDRARKLAENYLQNGMMCQKLGAIPDALAKLSSATGYGSHGAVIDFAEASALQLSVEWLPPDTDLWRRIWLLHCLYDADTKRGNLGKIFEGGSYSLARRPIDMGDG